MSGQLDSADRGSWSRSTDVEPMVLRDYDTGAVQGPQFDGTDGWAPQHFTYGLTWRLFHRSSASVSPRTIEPLSLHRRSEVFSASHFKTLNC